ncbi:hypothetical protein SS05631_c30130 [Sinorhizobium sp. CCBAU 05631]|nr:hypothetical protein SS05631_c30130 [Sinorhizobium sp. CCBAU 05631]
MRFTVRVDNSVSFASLVTVGQIPRPSSSAKSASRTATSCD